MGIPLRTNGFDACLVDGKEDNEVCFGLVPLVLPVVPLVDGRYERAVVIVINRIRSQLIEGRSSM